MTNKNTFLLFADRLEILDELTDEDAGKLFKAIVEYVKNGTEPPRGTLTSIAFRGIKNGIDVANESYERLCLKNRENGKKGGRPKAQAKPKEPSGIIENPDEPKKTQRLFTETQKTLTKTKTDTKTTLSNERDITPDGVIKKTLQKKFSKPTYEEVCAYCTERGNNIDPQEFIDFYESKGWRIGDQPMKNWQACIRTWELRRKDKHQVRIVNDESDYERRARLIEEMENGGYDGNIFG